MKKIYMYALMLVPCLQAFPISITIREITQDSLTTRLSQECKCVYVDAFALAYTHASAEELGISEPRELVYQQWACNFPEEYLTTLFAYGAFVEDHLVGFIFFAIRDENELYIALMATHPQHMHQDVGSLLITSCLNRYKNITKIIVATRTINQMAINFYCKHGFTVTSTLPAEDLNPQAYVGFEKFL